MEPLNVEDAEEIQDDDLFNEENISNSKEAQEVTEEIEVIVPAINIHPYICSLCDFKCKSENMLNRHVKCHLQCQICEKSFHGSNARRNYVRHLKAHELITPKSAKPPEQPIKKKSKKFDCPKCDQNFEFRSYLHRHVEKTHGTNWKKRLNFQNSNETPEVQTPLIFEKELEVSNDNLPKKKERKQKICERNHF